MPRIDIDEVYVDGVSVAQTQRVVSDSDIEAEESEGRLRQATVLLRQWAADGRTPADYAAMTAQQRIARQAELDERIAALARIVLALGRRVVG